MWVICRLWFITRISSWGDVGDWEAPRPQSVERCSKCVPANDPERVQCEEEDGDYCCCWAKNEDYFSLSMTTTCLFPPPASPQSVITGREAVQNIYGLHFCSYKRPRHKHLHAEAVLSGQTDRWVLAQIWWGQQVRWWTTWGRWTPGEAGVNFTSALKPQMHLQNDVVTTLCSALCQSRWFLKIFLVFACQVCRQVSCQPITFFQRELTSYLWHWLRKQHFEGLWGEKDVHGTGSLSSAHLCFLIQMHPVNECFLKFSNSDQTKTTETTDHRHA